MAAVGENQLIASIYEAASGVSSWRSTLDLIARGLDLWAVQLLAIAKTPGGFGFSHVGGSAAPQSALDYLHRHRAFNPRIPQLLALGPDEWLRDDDAIDDEYVARSSFAQGFLIPYRCRQCLGAQLCDSEEITVLLVAIRRLDQPSVGPAELPLLDTLRFHLRRAMESVCSVRSAAIASSAGVALLDRLSQPIVMIDELRLIRLRNKAAERALAGGDYALDRGGTLTLVDPAADRQLLLAVRALDLGAPPATTVASRQFVRAERFGPGTPIAIVVTRVLPRSTSGVFAAMPLALLAFHDLSEEMNLDGELIGELFRLTPAEARIAANIARGRRPEQIAVEADVAIATIRSQIKSIFAKTGVTRLPELASLLARLPDCKHDLDKCDPVL